VARAVQRAAEALAPAASSAATAPIPEPPPRLPGQPPEHWLAVVSEHAPELLIGVDRPATEFGRPLVPGYADPLAAPPPVSSSGERGGAQAAARRVSAPETTADAARRAIASTTARDDSVSDAPSAWRRAAKDGDDRPGERIRETGRAGTANRMAPAWQLAQLAGAVWERMTGRAPSVAPRVRPSVHGGHDDQPVPALRLTPAREAERFPAWSWIGPHDTADRARPGLITTAAAWPSLPAVISHGAPTATRPAVSHSAAPLGDEPDPVNPWPSLPDDNPLWTMPGSGFAAERVARLEREQAGG
jgi:hypothetical protein